MVCSNPKPGDVIWTKEGKVINGMQENGEINSLVIKNINSSQFGNYTCSINIQKFGLNWYNFTILVEQGNLFSHNYNLAYTWCPFHFK